MTRKQKRLLARILSAAALLVLSMALPVTNIIKAALAGAGYIIVGYDILKKALVSVRHMRALDENFLMAVATVGAIAIAVFQKSGDFFEAVAVMLFYQIGELFQGYAAHKSRKSISNLMDIRPDYANIEIDGMLERVNPQNVEVGTEIIVKPGERIPIDAVVIEGLSELDMTALTGESLPKSVSAGDEVISGSINMTGVLKLKTTKVFGDSAVSRVLKMVEESAMYKARSERFISRFAKVYTPIVCILALAIAVLVPLFNIIIGNDAHISTWIYRALTMLVISCPCALVLSIPLSFFAGLGGASREGILIKGANFIEILSRIDTVVFDKTGTLTKGRFEVSNVHSLTKDPERLLEYAAMSESASSHPIAKSLTSAFGKDIDRSRIQALEETVGEGVMAVIDGIKVLVGNEKFMQRFDIRYEPCCEAKAVVYVAIDGIYSGNIEISDVLKPESKLAITELKDMGIRNITMLTGDKKEVADKICKELNIDQFFSELLPHQKMEILEEILENSTGKVAFVGDGINDAPSLMRADIGFAMGGIGSDAAIEAADVVLMEDNPLKVAKAIRISKRCMRIVKQNIIFALLVKIVSILLAAAGLADMWLAVFADVGVMVLAVLNAVRTLNTKKV